MTYQTEVLADAPVVYLELNDTSGTAAVDQGSHAVNGTYTGGVTLNQSGPAGVTPVAQFDGVDDYVTIPDHNDLDIVGDLTLEMWVYPTSFGNYRMLITKTLSDVGPYQWLLRTGDGIPDFRFGSQSILGTTAPTLNAWNHMAATRSGTTVTHYLNGVTNGGGTTSGSIAANSEPVRIGRRSDNNFFFVGKLGQAAIFGTALSQARLVAHLNALPPPTMRVTQVPIETLIAPTPNLRVTQVPVEALIMPDGTMRVTQVPVEALIAPTPTMRVTQLVVETLVSSAAVVSAAPPRVIWF